MGLAGAKNKRKLGNDPNNTKWSRNTDTFGQKMLRAQGWEPGQYLGAQGAEHAQWHTEANATHIRVVLKDDQLGLGAKRNNGDECVGLDAFQMLLGRLNGKSEDALETEKKAREDLKLNSYVERKVGTIRFVSGGFLVGDQLVENPAVEKGISTTSSAEDSTATSEDESEEEAEELKKASKKSKKRKASEDSSEGEGKKKSNKEKKEKKSKKRKAEAEAEADAESSSREKKKSKKRKTSDDDDDDDEESAADRSSSDAKESKHQRKERREREKREKKERKEKRREEKAARKSATETGDDTSSKKKRRKVESESAVTSGVSTPIGSGTSTPTITGSSRYLARSRFIAQKKLAFTDTAALNQIFMIKS